MSVGAIYFLCFGAGLFYAIIVGLSGHLFGGDVDHHMDVGTDLPVSPMSPTVISTFLTGFGGGGLLANSYFHLGPAAGVGVALLTGALLSGGTFAAISFLFRSTQAGSEFAFSDLVGSVVQVVTPIPENGTGEVAMVAKGTRINSPARSADGKAIPRNAAAKVERVVGNVFYVRVVSQ